MAVHRGDFEEGRKLTSEDCYTLETGTLVFWKGALLEFYKMSGGRVLQVCLREPNSKIPCGTPLLTSLRLAVAKQEESSDYEHSTSYDEETHLKKKIELLLAQLELMNLQLLRARK